MGDTAWTALFSALGGIGAAYFAYLGISDRRTFKMHIEKVAVLERDHVNCQAQNQLLKERIDELERSKLELQLRLVDLERHEIENERKPKNK